MNANNVLVVFESKKIRRMWFKDEWYYSLVDVVQVLTNSNNSTDYLKKLRKRDIELGSYIGTNCPHIDMFTESQKKRRTLAGSTKDIFRLIQSIPSSKAEPFKLWLAQVGYHHVKEIENPELAQKRMRELYKEKGYSDEWIEKRVRGIAIRDELTGEWKKRGVEKNKDFAILTAEISKATFDMTPNEYKKFKGLEKENLRDHMDDLELIFSMLGEKVSTEITRSEDAQGYDEVENAAKRGGKIAGNARKETEKELRRPVTSKENYLIEQEKIKRLSLKNKKFLS